MDYISKQLTRHDIADLKALLTVFGDAFDEIDTYQNAIPSDSYLRSLLEKSHIVVLVAQNKGEIVGGLVAYVLEKLEQDRREIYLYDLAVSVDHRRKGVATLLINTLKDIAREKDAYVIFVQADRQDRPAVLLYESLGTREEVYHFDIPLSS